MANLAQQVYDHIYAQNVLICLAASVYDCTSMGTMQD